MGFPVSGPPLQFLKSSLPTFDILDYPGYNGMHNEYSLRNENMSFTSRHLIPPAPNRTEHGGALAREGLK
jgi:hypothetical protein